MAIVVTDASGVVHRTHTGINGQYELPGLGPGQYDFEATLSGFKQERAPLFLNGRAPMQRDVALALGSLSEELTVSGSVAEAARGDAPRPVQSRSAGYVPRPCVSEAAGGDIKEPRKIFDVKPRYPSDLITGQVAGVVSQWRFTPTLLNCEPVEVEINITVNFTVGR